MTIFHCPGSTLPPKVIREGTGSGWCMRCPDQHVLDTNGVIPSHNRDKPWWA